MRAKKTPIPKHDPRRPMSNRDLIQTRLEDAAFPIRPGMASLYEAAECGRLIAEALAGRPIVARKGWAG